MENIPTPSLEQRIQSLEETLARLESKMQSIRNKIDGVMNKYVTPVKEKATAIVHDTGEKIEQARTYIESRFNEIVSSFQSRINRVVDFGSGANVLPAPDFSHATPEEKNTGFHSYRVYEQTKENGKVTATAYGEDIAPNGEKTTYEYRLHPSGDVSRFHNGEKVAYFPQQVAKSKPEETAVVEPKAEIKTTSPKKPNPTMPAVNGKVASTSEINQLANTALNRSDSEN